MRGGGGEVSERVGEDRRWLTAIRLRPRTIGMDKIDPRWAGEMMSLLSMWKASRMSFRRPDSRSSALYSLAYQVHQTVGD